MLVAPATLHQAVRALDASGLQIVLLTDCDDRLLGTLTDGDVRRALLRGATLEDPVEGAIQAHPVVLHPDQDTDDAARRVMEAHGIRHLPVVDQRGCIVGLRTWADVRSARTPPNLVVILAGGRGRRLQPHTDSCPKALLPVKGRPMLEHVVERARRQGFRRFTIAVHYRGDMIERHFGDGSAWNVHIDYLREDVPLGTAGALALLSPRPDTSLIVANGDVLSDLRFEELLDYHQTHQALATMAVLDHVWRHPYGVVRTDGIEIVGVEEKPVSRTRINAGIYALEPRALEALRPGEPCDMPTLFERLRDRGGRTIVFPMHEPWIDAGTPQEWQRAEVAMMDER